MNNLWINTPYVQCTGHLVLGCCFLCCIFYVLKLLFIFYTYNNNLASPKKYLNSPTTPASNTQDAYLQLALPIWHTWIGPGSRPINTSSNIHTAESFSLQYSLRWFLLNAEARQFTRRCGLAAANRLTYLHHHVRGCAHSHGHRGRRR